MPIIFSIGHHKRDIFSVETEVDISTGIFRFDIIGLGDKAVEESKLRILSALKNSGHKVSRTTEKITVLLSPANKKKEGSHFDLPIALSYLHKTGATKLRQDVVALGELSLSGSIRPVSHIAEYLLYASRLGIKKAIVPKENEQDISSIDELCTSVHISYASSLKEALLALDDPQGKDGYLETGDQRQNEAKRRRKRSSEQHKRTEFLIDRIVGQQHLKRALAISLAGMHHLMIVGAPGTGKSMLAKSAEELLPEFNPAELMHGRDSDFASIKKLKGGGRLVQPHHTASYAEIIGSKNTPGFIHDSHGGILLMDEWAEFDRRAIESLRQPLEEGIQAGEPCSFICIATTNPCPCGYFQSKAGSKCICKKDSQQKYLKKIFGPATQRFDLVLTSDELSLSHKYQDSTDNEQLKGEAIKEAVNRVRALQKNRLAAEIGRNETLSRKQARLLAAELVRKSLSIQAAKMMNEAINRHRLSQRSAEALILVARTIADLDGEHSVLEKHLEEALTYALKENLPM